MFCLALRVQFLLMIVLMVLGLFVNGIDFQCFCRIESVVLWILRFFDFFHRNDQQIKTPPVQSTCLYQSCD